MAEQRDDVTITEEDGEYTVTANYSGYWHMPNGVHYFEVGEELAVVDDPEDALFDYLGEKPTDFLND